MITDKFKMYPFYFYRFIHSELVSCQPCRGPIQNERFCMQLLVFLETRTKFGCVGWNVVSFVQNRRTAMGKACVDATVIVEELASTQVKHMFWTSLRVVSQFLEGLTCQFTSLSFNFLFVFSRCWCACELRLSHFHYCDKKISRKKSVLKKMHISYALVFLKNLTNIFWWDCDS